MRLLVSFLIVLLGQTALAMASVDADQAELIERMKAGGHILMIRHALAPGTGDPANFQIGDCSTQRNLDDRGRDQAKSIGKWLRSKGVISSRVYSSQWCRCLETADLIDMGPVTELPALNSFYELTENRESNLKALRKFIAQQRSDGALIILVTHYVTIAAITDQGVSSGDGVLIEIQEDAPFRIAGRLSFKD